MSPQEIYIHPRTDRHPHKAVPPIKTQRTSNLKYRIAINADPAIMNVIELVIPTVLN